MEETLKDIRLTVYGADIKCPSCVNAPGSRETFEWLQAAITRKYGAEGVCYQYIDFEKDPYDEEHLQYIQQIENEERFYPLIVIEDEVAGEGNPRLKRIYQMLENHGLEDLASRE
ncbi:YuzD family protein [Halobacillus salinarum]|uniref:YuzD family protein n=1 Tax=Halobacillus salinarum TaxID=2932257 RepID=A0ABY4ENT6_9BACI|nr:YuzD family protein [Halobacillus salinarum]UOQ46050.1 YuzD family protein [Halobacillus salinarum]